MRYLKVIIFCILLGLLIFEISNRWTSEAPHAAAAAHPSWQEAFKYAQDNLPKEGKLTRKSDGFIYLKVDDRYIHSLFPKLGLKQDGFHEPPYFRTRNAPGAHISVFYVDEHIIPKELGQTFHFEPKEIVIVNPSKNVSYAVLEVTSPELEKLRQKYGLNPKIHGHDYHISLAKKNHY